MEVLDNGVSYWFKVRAFNARGRGDESAEVEATPVVASLVLSGPVEVKVAEVVLPATTPREVATYTATAADGATVAWSLAGLDEEAFTVSAAGVLSFAEGPDYEAPTDTGHDTDADGNNVYHISPILLPSLITRGHARRSGYPLNSHNIGG